MKREVIAFISGKAKPLPEWFVRSSVDREYRPLFHRGNPMSYKVAVDASQDNGCTHRCRMMEPEFELAHAYWISTFAAVGQKKPQRPKIRV
jgi:hypothetical protein